MLKLIWELKHNLLFLSLCFFSLKLSSFDCNNLNNNSFLKYNNLNNSNYNINNFLNIPDKKNITDKNITFINAIVKGYLFRKKYKEYLKTDLMDFTNELRPWFIFVNI